MKILTWNCNGGLRKKFEHLADFNADICIIQECENPAETNHKKYNDWAENYLWIGDSKNKGVGIFASKEFQVGLKTLIFGEFEKWIQNSDHLPIVCEFENIQ